MTMVVELTDRAKIALDHLPPNDVKQALRMISFLKDFPNGVGLKGKYHKLSGVDERMYLGRASPQFRIVFRVIGEMVSVLDIVHHDRLERLFNVQFGGAK